MVIVRDLRRWEGKDGDKRVVRVIKKKGYNKNRESVKEKSVEKKRLLEEDSKEERKRGNMENVNWEWVLGWKRRGLEEKGDMI